MHLKPISRELRRELYGRRRKGYEHIQYYIEALSKHACVVVCVAFYNNYSFSTTAAIGPGLNRERGDLAQGTEVEEEEEVEVLEEEEEVVVVEEEEAEEEEEEVAVTVRDVALETESVQDDSEAAPVTTCPSLPVSTPGLFLSLYPSRTILGLIKRYQILKL